MRSLAIVLVPLALAAALGACDPVHSDSVDALGGEAPGVRKGPLHRPGQPCLRCHDGDFGDPPEFSVAGTIFESQTELRPAVGATVHLTMHDGRTFDATTNEAGNFYLTPSELTPTYPMKVEVQARGARTSVKMSTTVGRYGACAECHSDPAGPTSAGHVFIPADGRTP